MAKRKTDNNDNNGQVEFSLARATGEEPLSFEPLYTVGDVLELDPKDLVIAQESKFDPLFDKRAEDEDKELAAAMATEGFNSLIQVVERANPDDPSVSLLHVVAGRRRALAAIEAGVAVQALVLNPKLSDWQLVGAMISENELRKADNLINKAHKAQRFVELFCEQFRPTSGESAEVGDDGEIVYNGVAWKATAAQRREATSAVAARCGVSERRVRQFFELLTLAPAVQKAIEAGKVSGEIARGWKDLTHDQQTRRLAKELEKAATTAGSGSGKASAWPNKIAFNRATLETLYEQGEGLGMPANVLNFLSVYLGYNTVEDAGLKWLTKAIAPVIEEDGDEDDDE